MRANEFLEVGKTQAALDVLYNVIKHRNHQTWQKIPEPIMLKFLELCVDLRKSHLAKEGLYQYQNICQQCAVERCEWRGHWVKFLWESYRQCLDLLRNNSKVERLYHDIAQ
ncbi:eukaryotic translation initiation factor 3 subunit A [Silurus asotus]|uniref:Eukaryotic translation initiation factor 3 subunit A n=1 Tax=Silurus asotus TaxID=30991 RepID=A0AAD5A7W8_SILAS|nr:eukaryotic translation initiation factor 3 subunit A [Silurus asotus]